MEIQSLKYIIALAKTKNFSDAAEECNISQSSLSKHLKKVESEIGDIELFDRSKRPFSITIAGYEFIQYAQNIVNYYQQLEDSMKKYISNSDEILRIGMIPYARRIGLLQIIKHYTKANNGSSQLKIADATSDALLAMLEDEKLDVAFITYPSIPHEPNYTYFELSKNRIGLLSLRTDLLPESVSLSDIKSKTIIVPDKQTGVYKACVKKMNSAGIKTNIITCKNIETVIDFVLSGIGVAMLSEKLIQSLNIPDLKGIKLNDEILYSVVLVVKNSNYKKRHVQNFIKFTLEHSK